MALSFTPLPDIRSRIGESPVYDERLDQLWFVDIPERQLHRWDVRLSELRSWTFQSEVCSLGLAASGRLVVALRDRVVLFDPRTDTRQELCTVEADRPETRLNDGKVGPDGAFWVGSMDDRQDKQAIGALYRVDPSGRVDRKVDGLTVSNGLAWTADGEVMFHADSRGPWIDRWDFDRWTGEIAGRRRFATLDDATGRPDGGACDAEGYYWSAGVSAGRLNRFAADGTLSEAHDLPVPSPTMPCFGGADFRTLFLTSLTREPQAETRAKTPLAGALLTGLSPVAGFAPWRFLDI